MIYLCFFFCISNNNNNNKNEKCFEAKKTSHIQEEAQQANFTFAFYLCLQLLFFIIY